MYSVFICPSGEEGWLKANGAMDSKQVSEGDREAFFGRLLNDAPTLGWRAKVLHPEHISNCMLRREKYNLNQLSYDTVFEIISSLLNDGVHIDAAFVDTLGKPEKYQALLHQKFPNINFTVRSKADVLFPVVGAASIVAKVLRDDILKEMGVGASGYPGDAATVAWLRSNVDPIFGFPNVVRFSWSSCAELLREKCVPVVWNDRGNDDDLACEQDKENRQRKRAMQKKKTPAVKFSPFGLTSNISLPSIN